jgi:4-hydroxyphenylpyruvate dioxygenase
VSRALTSPCGKIRIPLNESPDETSQIVEYLKKYKGEGIQHIAVGTDDIYDATDKLAANGLKFMPGPPETYYERSYVRVVGHEEPVERMKKHGILIDGEGVVDGGMTKILLQIFSKTVIGPIFFEFIQRKGDDGFGEGNFRALFESIEEDQIRRGVCRGGRTLETRHGRPIDPFDLLIVAQAMLENLTLITVDAHMKKFDVETL